MGADTDGAAERATHWNEWIGRCRPDETGRMQLDIFEICGGISNELRRDDAGADATLNGLRSTAAAAAAGHDTARRVALKVVIAI